MSVTNPSRGASTAKSGLLWSATTLEDWYEIQQAEPSRTSLVLDPAGSGEKVFKVECNGADVFPKTATENPRCQMHSPGLFYPGAPLWVHSKLYIPESMPEFNGAYFFTLLSVFGAPSTEAAPFAIYAGKEEVSAGKFVQCFFWQRNLTYGFDIPWIGLTTPLQRGRWYEFLVRTKFATASLGGFVELWWDGNQIKFFNPTTSYNPRSIEETTKLHMNVEDSAVNENPNEVYAGIYHKKEYPGMAGTVYVYYWPMKIGLTKTAVGF